MIQLAGLSKAREFKYITDVWRLGEVWDTRNKGGHSEERKQGFFLRTLGRVPLLGRTVVSLCLGHNRDSRVGMIWSPPPPPEDIWKCLGTAVIVPAKCVGRASGI